MVFAGGPFNIGGPTDGGGPLNGGSLPFGGSICTETGHPFNIGGHVDGGGRLNGGSLPFGGTNFTGTCATSEATVTAASRPFTRGGTTWGRGCDVGTSLLAPNLLLECSLYVSQRNSDIL